MRTVTPFFYTFALFVMLSLSLLSRAIAAVTITVDAQTAFQTMHGFGSSERVFDDPHVFNNFDSATGKAATILTPAEQNEILDRLYVDLGFTRVRPVTEAGIEVRNDNDDPENTDLSKFNFAWKRNDAHVDYVQRAMARGVTEYFLSPIFLEDWMTEANPREYVEWAMAIIRRWRSLGLEIPYYSITNEPGYSRGGIWSGEYIRDVIKLLGPKLRAEGFNTKFVITDDLNASQAYQRCQIILAAVEARQYIGALAFHLYDEPISNVAQMTRLGATYGLPLWMTEYYQSDPLTWANTMHDLVANYNVSAVDYLWGFFGEWEGQAAQLITLKNLGSQYLGYELTKHYYLVGQFSRWVKSGFKRVKANSTDNSVKVTAYTNDQNLVLVVINNAGTEKTIQFELKGISAVAEMYATRTSEAENWATLPTLAIRESRFVATVPPRSVTTFANRGATSPVIATLESPESGPVSGIAVIRGWAFAAQAGVQISSVELFIDGVRSGDVPCCSERGDVQAAFPQFPVVNTLNSGWGITFNWGNLGTGTHTVRVEIRSTAGASFSSETRTVTVIKPGDFPFLDRFALSGATVRIAGDELIVEGITVRDEATRQQKRINTRFRWFASSQSLQTVEAVTTATLSSLRALFAESFAVISARLLRLSATPTAQATSGMVQAFESPEEGQAASGIAVIRGWAFADAPGASMREVRLVIDGQPGSSIPCCSQRGDVAASYPGNPNALNSGWGFTINYGNLPAGAHTIGVRLGDFSGSSLTLNREVTVVKVGGFAFLDQFDLSSATARIEEEEIVVSGVYIRDKNSQQIQVITIRLRWFQRTQALGIVSSAG